MRILLSGFEPFDGESSNPSWDAVARLAAESSPNSVHAVRIPTVFGTAITTLRAAIAKYRPDLVISVGQAGGRSALSLERVAVNVDDARIPDSAGYQPIDEPVVPGGPAAYFSGLPIKACVAGLRAAGIPAEVSQTAGTFVCNHLFYGLMHLVDTEYPELRGGFVHVPFAPRQVVGGRTPSMTVDLMVEGLSTIVATSVGTKVDRRLPGGAVS